MIREKTIKHDKTMIKQLINNSLTSMLHDKFQIQHRHSLHFQKSPAVLTDRGDEVLPPCWSGLLLAALPMLNT